MRYARFNSRHTNLVPNMLSSCFRVSTPSHYLPDLYSMHSSHTLFNMVCSVSVGSVTRFPLACACLADNNDEPSF